jgi:hypothetical protein
VRDSRRAAVESGMCRREARHCCNASTACPPFWYNIQPMKQKSTIIRKKSREKSAEKRFLTDVISKNQIFPSGKAILYLNFIKNCAKLNDYI